MKSNVIRAYGVWLEGATKKDIDFVDRVYAICEKHYESGGSTIVECFEPAEVLEHFKTIKAVKEYCRLRVENATNYRWGEDTDPEINIRGEW
jgi:hypothetical protein